MDLLRMQGTPLFFCSLILFSHPQFSSLSHFLSELCTLWFLCINTQWSPLLLNIRFSVLAPHQHIFCVCKSPERRAVHPPPLPLLPWEKLHRAAASPPALLVAGGVEIECTLPSVDETVRAAEISIGTIGKRLAHGWFFKLWPWCQLTHTNPMHIYVYMCM